MTYRSAPKPAVVVGNSKLTVVPKPVGWRVLIKVEVLDEKHGSIFLPEQFREDQKYVAVLGTIVKIGPLAWQGEQMRDAGPWAKVGDRVIFSKHAGQRLDVNGSEYRLLNDDEIFGVVEE